MSNLFGSKKPKKAHLVKPGGGVAGEVHDLRQDVEESFESLESGGGYFRTDEFTDPPAADPNGIKLSIATSNGDRVFSGSDLDGVVGEAEMVPPRNPTVTSTTHADVDAVSVVFRGKLRNSEGQLVDHEVTVGTTDGGGATDAGTDVLSLVEEIEVPAMAGAGGALEFGFGALIGLSAKMKSRAGLLAPIRQIAVGVAVTTGAFTNPANSIVTSYAPASAPDGIRDYAVTYEVDPS